MNLTIATEDIEPNHWVAWIQELPGCYSSAPTEDAAVALAPRRVAAYLQWVAAKDPSLAVQTLDFSTELTQRFRSFYGEQDPDYYVNAFFDEDARPLAYWDVVIYRRLLAWTREDLLTAVRKMTRNRIAGVEDDAIAPILHHLAGTENWYLSHLGLDVHDADLPAGSLERLEAVRAGLLAKLPNMVGDDRIVTTSGEQWSARKILRRALWHEREHTEQIAELAERAYA